MDEQIEEDYVQTQNFQSSDIEPLCEGIKCGYSVHREDALPKTFRSCNASKSEFTLYMKV